MRRLAAIALAFFAFTSLAAARAEDAGCVPPPGADDVKQAAAKFPPRDRGLLWRLEKDGRTSWLYGTIHVGKPEWIVPGPTIMRALMASDTVVLELDLSKPEEIQAMVDAPVDRASAERVLAGGLGARLTAQLRKNCVPDAIAGRVRPALQVVAAAGVAARAAGLHPELGIDLLLNGMAPRLGKPVVALETVKQQMAFLIPASEDEERAMVADSLGELESQRTLPLLRRMANAWERGDAGEIATYTQWCDCVNTPSEKLMLHRLLDERNPAMADKLVALHDKGKTFFAAVGSLHMSGEQSLVTLLRSRGFTVTPVAFAS
jgi:uncharacterized protein